MCVPHGSVEPGIQELRKHPTDFSPLDRMSAVWAGKLEIVGSVCPKGAMRVPHGSVDPGIPELRKHPKVSAPLGRISAGWPGKPEIVGDAQSRALWSVRPRE